MIRIRHFASFAALACAVMVGPVAAQQLVEPIPQRRDAAATKPLKPQPRQEAMVPCPEYGPGFGRLPGSSTCVKIGGSVRGEFGARGQSSRLGDQTGFSTQMRLLIDTRTPTDIGTVRAVMSLRGQTNSGFPTNTR